ncbi:MAG: hypothetical protein J3K34DRAFT_224759 [Monoraphidium minutum]|nr:MAG: hypothetical protein J3K34DRAFT_224759 [Monoraphidium minutum]
MQAPITKQAVAARPIGRPLTTRALPSAVGRQRCQQQQQRVEAAQQQQQQQQQERPQRSLGAALGAAALSLGLLLSGPVLPPAALAKGVSSLAEVVRSQYPVIARDADGVITRSDLEVFNEEMWLEWVEEGGPIIGNGDPDFALKLFDLNQDGTVEPEEVLRALALDGAVNERSGNLDPNIFEAFDANGNGFVDAEEWADGLGDIGPDGDGTKRFIFGRVAKLADAKTRGLDADSFGAAVGLARDILLGGGPTAGLTSTMMY